MLKTVPLGFTIAVGVLAAMPARADICAWVGPAVAKKAATMIKAGETVQNFCPGCGDTVSKPMQVTTVDSGPVPGQPTYYQVSVNGAGIDLAYVYVRTSPTGPWTNLGTLVSCSKDNDSPRTLAANKVGKLAQGNDRL